VDVYRSVSDIPDAWPGCALAIGNFDGVHLGHQRLLAALRDQAARKGVPPAVLTFDPHPAAVLRPGSDAPVWIMPVARRLELLASLGIGTAVVIGRDPGFFAQTAGEFVSHMLAGRFRARAVVEGPDFRFGMDRKGNVETLREWGREFGFDTLVVDPVPAPIPEFAEQGMCVSSTLIRRLIAEGRVAEAGQCLGRPVEIQGPVAPGAARGRKLGFPTANLDFAQSHQMLPAAGVYAGLLEIPDADDPAVRGPHKAAVSVGAPPTFPGEPVRVEAFALDFSGDLYGRTARVSLLERLRGLVAFPGPAELTRQIAEDVRRARQIAAAALGK
jgi:riboflavin kinase/FMN adenylyltransferase